MRNRRVLIGLVAALLSFPVIAQNAAKSTRKQAATENADTLSGIWSQNWILKLKPCDTGTGWIQSPCCMKNISVCWII